MALLEASRVGHERLMESFDPRRLVYVAAQAQRTGFVARNAARLRLPPLRPRNERSRTPRGGTCEIRTIRDACRTCSYPLCRKMADLFLGVFRRRVHGRRRGAAQTEKADPVQDPSRPMQAVSLFLEEVLYLRPVPVAVDCQEPVRVSLDTGDDLGSLGPRFSAREIARDDNPIGRPEERRGRFERVPSPRGCR